MTMPYVGKRSKLFLFGLPLALLFFVACESEFHWEPPVQVEHEPVSMKVFYGDSVVAEGDASSVSGTINVYFMQRLAPVSVVFYDADGEAIVPAEMEYMEYENEDTEIAIFSAMSPGDFTGDLVGRGVGTTTVQFTFAFGPIGGGEPRLAAAKVNIEVHPIPTPEPALHTDDFEANAIGDTPAGWRGRWYDEEQWLTTVQLRGNKVMRHNTTTSGIRFVQWQVPGRALNVELLGRTMTGSGYTGTQSRLAGRAWGDYGMEFNYQFEFRNEGGVNWVRLSFYTGGAFIVALHIRSDDPDVPNVWEYDEWYWLRFKIDGWTLYGKIWHDDDPEPDFWSGVISDPRLSQAGEMGIGGFGTGYRYYDYIAAGTYGISPEVPVGYDLGPEVDVTLDITPSAPAPIRIGAMLDLEAEVLDENGDPVGYPVAWISRDTTVATVFPDGRVFGVGEGSTSILAEVEGEHRSVSITVLDI